MEEARPLSLRDRIRQLEQAAHSPLTEPSSTRHSTLTSSKGPTSSAQRRHHGTAAHSLSVQQVAHADDPLQQSHHATTLSPAISPSTPTSGRSAPPPLKPPRPVWVSSRTRDGAASGRNTDTRAEAETGRGDRDHATTGGGPSQATLAGPDVALRGAHPSTQITQAAHKIDSNSTSPSRSISPTMRSKPALPARPPAATVTSPIRSDTPQSSSISHPSAALTRINPSGTDIPAPPALPPRPAWARKPSPAASPGSLPIEGSRGSTPAPPSSHLGRRDSSRRDTASSAGSTGGTSPATFPAAGAVPGSSSSSSSSPALPPRPRGAPSPAPRKTETKSSAVVAAYARRRYDRLFSQCVEAAAAAATARPPSVGSEERLDGAVIGELWRRSRLDDAVLRRIWCVLSLSLARSFFRRRFLFRRRPKSAGRSVHLALVTSVSLTQSDTAGTAALHAGTKWRRRSSRRGAASTGTSLHAGWA